jgi:hypothetical protein
MATDIHPGGRAYPLVRGVVTVGDVARYRRAAAVGLLVLDSAAAYRKEARHPSNWRAT